MKKSILALGILSLATIANAQHSSGEVGIGGPHGSVPNWENIFPGGSSGSSSGSSSSSEEAADEQKSIAAWALYNVSGDALDLANDYRDNPGIGNTTAGTYLTELAADTRPLRTAAGKLAALLRDGGSQADIDAQLKIIKDRYADVRGANTKAANQLAIQGFIHEGTQVRNAYTKVRSRWVYLQGLLD